MDSPFRLAPLATHPLSGGGQEKHGGEGRLTQNLAPPLVGGRGTTSLPQILPPPACRGEGDHVPQTLASPRSRGEGDRVSGGRGSLQAGIRTLSKEREPSNIKGHPPSFTIALTPPFRLAPLATHPPSGGGQEKHRVPLPSRSARQPPPSGGGREKHGCPFPSRTARHPSPEAGMGR